MPLVALKAHFDGEAIRLDETFDLPAGAELVVIFESSVPTSQEGRDGKSRPLRRLYYAKGEPGDEDEPTALAYTPNEFFGNYEDEDKEEDDSPERL